MIKTLLYEKLDNQKVRCLICNHFCVIDDKKRGICKVRENQNGTLFNLVYPKIIANSVDPIEKKPIFHLKPGSFSYSIATVGCNFKCAFCQNSNIAHMPSDRNGLIQGTNISPETIVLDALRANCKSISYTYTEPTIFFELAFETAKLAKQNGLLNVFVTNGYMSDQALDMILPYLDAANVDLKAFDDKFYQTYCKAKIEPVKNNIKKMKDNNVLVELTTLLIPELNNDKEQIRQMSEFIAQDIGKDTPWHISRFHPSYKVNNIGATLISDLEYACKIGIDAGLQYVYMGNVAGQPYEHTYCPNCKTLVIKRYGYKTEDLLKDNGKCPQCDTIIYGIY